MTPYDHPDGTVHYLSNKEARSVSRLTPYINLPWLETLKWSQRESLGETRQAMNDRPGKVDGPAMTLSELAGLQSGRPMRTINAAIHWRRPWTRGERGQTVCGMAGKSGAMFGRRVFGNMIANAAHRCCERCAELYFSALQETYGIDGSTRKVA